MVILLCHLHCLQPGRLYEYPTRMFHFFAPALPETKSQRQVLGGVMSDLLPVSGPLFQALLGEESRPSCLAALFFANLLQSHLDHRIESCRGSHSVHRKAKVANSLNGRPAAARVAVQGLVECSANPVPAVAVLEDSCWRRVGLILPKHFVSCSLVVTAVRPITRGNLCSQISLAMCFEVPTSNYERLLFILAITSTHGFCCRFFPTVSLGEMQ